MLREETLMEGINTSLFNMNFESNFSYQHKLLNNKNEKIITTLRRELEECEEFIISVAFITESGLTLILEQLKKLEDKNIKGKILSGDYLNFTQPKALLALKRYKNIELKLLTGESLHSKGFFFKRKNYWNVIIGSSNLTQTALTTNLEWNLKLTSLENGKIIKDILEDFNEIYSRLSVLSIEEIKNYELLYKDIKNRFNYIKHKKEIGDKKEIIPNMMQVEALKNLEELRLKNKSKALLISATGTGKTFLSALDVKKVNPKKFLFIAHRKNILTKSKESFQKIIKHKNMEIYDKNKGTNSDYIFAMVQTLNKKENLEMFEKDYFDYILIDEVHHSGAQTYQNIINYFKPKFFLGMTATPERSDDIDIYKLFDYNIAYEIRLHEALKEKLLCPFHYFGISDIVLNGELVGNETTILNLSSEERVNHVIEKMQYYGYSGDKIHGLIFVHKIEEAKLLSEALNKKGLKTAALTGESTEAQRENEITKLENGELEYIITVDIFNEGIDIPCVNQVVLLRPTESSIVYIQQLGRGLRKNADKEYVVILDFIGNYNKNFLIPVAMSQNNSYDKDFMKKFLISGTEHVPGESSIVFEDIVKERIFENIKKTNFSTKNNIQHDYELLKKQLGRTPYLNDFFKRNMIEPSVILKYKHTYDEVLLIFEKKELLGELNILEKKYLKFLSQHFTPAKRIHEIIIFDYLLKNESADISELTIEIEKNLKVENQKLNTENALKHLSKEFFLGVSTITEYSPLIIKNKEKYVVNKSFDLSFNTNLYFKNLIIDLISYNLNYVKKNYPQISEKSIIEYKEYTKLEAFWNLNMDYNNGYQVRGYTIFEKEKKALIFITLDDSSSFTSYDNKILDKQKLIWFSTNNRCLKRKNKITKEGLIAQGFYELEIFVKKSSGENFYYLGQVENVISAKEILNSENKLLVQYEFKLKKEIEHSLFNYLVISK
ncbi:MAG: DUF3427 domain-containing protein [Fusobacteriaceae bacterium]